MSNTPKDRWNQVSGQVQIITKFDLWVTLGVEVWSLSVQDGMDFVQPNLVSGTLLDRLEWSL